MLLHVQPGETRFRPVQSAVYCLPAALTWRDDVRTARRGDEPQRVSHSGSPARTSRRDSSSRRTKVSGNQPTPWPSSTVAFTGLCEREEILKKLEVHGSLTPGPASDRTSRTRTRIKGPRASARGYRARNPVRTVPLCSGCQGSSRSRSPSKKSATATTNTSTISAASDTAVLSSFDAE